MLNIFDFFEQLIQHNKLAKLHKFHYTTYTATADVEGLLVKMRQHSNIFAVSDMTESRSYQPPGGAWFNRRIFSAFIIMRYAPKDINDQREKMSICRELLRQIHSKLLNEQVYSLPMARLVTEEMAYRELGANFLDSATGIHFQMAMDEPINLCFNAEEWEE